MKHVQFVAIACMLFLCSCGGKIRTKDGEVVSVPNPVKAAQEITRAAAAAKSRWEERKAKGDTMAMPYKEIEAFLPGAISDYSKDGGPKGSSMAMPGMGSWSQTEQRYTNGDKRIKVEIIDFNASQSGWSTYTAMYRMGFSSEDDNKRTGPVDLGMSNVSGYETVYKQKQNCELSVVAGDRFLIKLDSDGSNDIDLLKSTAKEIVNAGMSSKF
jgi:hypothetical protein